MWRVTIPIPQELPIEVETREWRSISSNRALLISSSSTPSTAKFSRPVSFSRMSFCGMPCRLYRLCFCLAAAVFLIRNSCECLLIKSSSCMEPRKRPLHTCKSHYRRCILNFPRGAVFVKRLHGIQRLGDHHIALDADGLRGRTAYAVYHSWGQFPDASYRPETTCYA
jgi:hypothetical protein